MLNQGLLLFFYIYFDCVCVWAGGGICRVFGPMRIAVWGV